MPSSFRCFWGSEFPRRNVKVSYKTLTLSIKIAQKPYRIGSLGPKALKYESFEGKGKALRPKLFESFEHLDLRPGLLRGSWALVIRVINKVTIYLIITPILVLITLLTTILTKSHDPPSRV